MTGDWALTVPEAVARQNALRDLVVAQPPSDFRPRLVGGADMSIEREGTVGYAGIVVIDTTTMQTVAEATAVVEVRFPYVPGLLSFRELPALEAAWAQLTVRPDVLVFDGVGYAHPRRFGLACHGGVHFRVPSVGCAKSILVGRHPSLGEARGAMAPLIDRGETVGMAIRLRAGVKPVYVSIGHLIDLETAIRVVQSVATGFREPETTRRAHRLVNAVRRAAGGAPP